MNPTNDNQSERERELRIIVLKVAYKLRGLASFDYEWELLKPAGLTPEELEWVKAEVRTLDRMVTAMEKS
jgi:hypothetical protein